MPLLITPPEPLTTTAAVELPAVYAIIETVGYKRRGLYPKRIVATVGYYAHEAASLTAEPVQVPGLLTEFFQDASPEEANQLPIFDFLDAKLKALLEATQPAGTLIERVS